jgi:hypothetical protein
LNERTCFFAKSEICAGGEVAFGYRIPLSVPVPGNAVQRMTGTWASLFQEA